jgi:hypothetical protein
MDHLKDTEAKTKKYFTAFNLQTNYTDQVAAVCWRSYCQMWLGFARATQRVLNTVYLGFLDLSRYFSFK